MPTHSDPTKGLLLADMTVDEAKTLDSEVDHLIVSNAEASIDLYVGLGRSLAKIHAGRGYRPLGFTSWREYLATKPDFGLTFLKYMVRLGEAAELGNLDLPRIKELGLSGSQLIEYAKATDLPNRIQDLIDMTAADLRGKTVVDTQTLIRAYVDAHWETYHAKPKPAPHDKPAPNWEADWEKAFKALDTEAQTTFIQHMWRFLEHHDSGAHPHQ
jgi:hypothetical protein